MPSTDIRWQNRMAPLMAGAVVVTAVFFAFIMLVRFSSIEATLQEAPPTQLAVTWTRQGIEPTTWRDQQQLASSEANFGLERELIARRYRVASAIMSLRLWTRLMGFLTGMILAMVGAAFTLGKLDAPESEIVGGASGATLSVKSASPGIVMAILGTVLIGMSLVVPVTAEVRDTAVYFGRTDTAAVDDAAPTEAADPAHIADIKLRPPADRGASQ
jgi:hypothetical protein